jgi:benzoyl-CoA reductase/2-hydroxyglutaryl-CoA dehydratase subunit BcrC/BadD/HgdB
MTTACERLRWHYENRAAWALEQQRAGRPVIGFTANTVPYELIRAAGAAPVLVNPQGTTTPLADEWMEPVFDHSIRVTFDRVLAGDWSFLKFLIAPRTSEQQYKLFLYLREAARQGCANLPPTYLYDLLHTRTPRSQRYGLERTRELAQRLAAATGHAITDESLTDAINESNAARAAIRRLLRLRRRAKPKLSGAEATALIGAWNFMDRKTFAELAVQAVNELKAAPSLKGPRLLLKGVALDHPRLHQVLESRGAIVIAEDDWHGSRAAGRDIALGKDLLAGVFRKYYRDADSPRVYPVEVADAWFQREALRNVDGVIFYLPPEDDIRGWDYPRQKQFLDERGIPHLLIREDFSEAMQEPIAAFVSNLNNQSRNG